MILKGQITGLVFISDNHPNYPNFKVGSILPFSRNGEWAENEIEVIGQEPLIDIFEINKSDNEIKMDLASRVEFYPDNLSISNFKEY